MGFCQYLATAPCGISHAQILNLLGFLLTFSVSFDGIFRPLCSGATRSGCKLDNWHYGQWRYMAMKKKFKFEMWMLSNQFDETGDYAESNEFNNSLPAPELRVLAVTASKQGNQITISYELAGHFEAHPATELPEVGFLLPSEEGGHVVMCTEPVLGFTGTLGPWTNTCTIPDGVSSTAHLFVFVDVWNVLTEFREDNNLKVYKLGPVFKIIMRARLGSPRRARIPGSWWPSSRSASRLAGIA